MSACYYFHYGEKCPYCGEINPIYPINNEEKTNEKVDPISN